MAPRLKEKYVKEVAPALKETLDARERERGSAT